MLAKLTDRPITLPKTDKVRHMFYDTCSDTVLAKLTNRPITLPKTDKVRHMFYDTCSDTETAAFLHML